MGAVTQALRCAGVVSTHGSYDPAASYVCLTRSGSRQVNLCQSCHDSLVGMGMRLVPDRRTEPRGTSVDRLR